MLQRSTVGLLIPTVLTRRKSANQMTKSTKSRARQTTASTRSTGPARGTYSRPASSAAGYRPYTYPVVNLVSSRPPVKRRPQPGSRPAVRRSIAHTTPPSRAVTRPKALNPLNRPRSVFGGWELPTARVAEAARRLLGTFLSPCERRKTRRQVLFSTRATGKGSSSPKLHFTNFKGCK